MNPCDFSVPRRAIWKFTLDKPATDFRVPVGSVVLAAGIQGDDIVIWMLVWTDADTEWRSFQAFNTGQEIPGDPDRLAEFVGSLTSKTGIVWHVFELHQEADDGV